LAANNSLDKTGGSGYSIKKLLPLKTMMERVLRAVAVKRAGKGGNRPGPIGEDDSGVAGRIKE
jgi:hypothetical protein